MEANEKRPWFKFFVDDWIGDHELRRLSARDHGVLIGIMCLCHKSPRYGFLLDADHTPYDRNDLLEILPCRLNADELDRSLNSLGKRRRIQWDNEHTLFVPRMVRDAEKRAVAQTHGRRGGNPVLRDKPHSTSIWGMTKQIELLEEQRAMMDDSTKNGRERRTAISKQIRALKVQIINFGKGNDNGSNTQPK